MRSSLVVQSMALLAFLASCSKEGGGPGQPSVTVVDSAGVSIIQNHDLDLDRSLLLNPTPSLQIGVLDGPEEYQLFRVSDVKRLSDGAVAVANGGSQELRIYEPDGTHRATAGGPGPGPTEFRFPSALVILPGDTIQVQDFMDRVLFSPEGTFLRRVTGTQLGLESLWEALGGISEGGQWTADGSYFAPVYHRSQNLRVPGPPYRPSMTLVRVSGDLTVIDTLGDFGGILQQRVEVGGRFGLRSMVPPFATSTYWSVGASDGTIVIGDNAEPQVHRFHPDGRRSIVRWTAEEEGITPAEVEEWKDQQRNADWTQGQLPELERGWAAMDIPDAKAFYGRVTAGSDGTLWVTETDSPVDSTFLMAFQPNGRFAGTILLPVSFIPYDSGPGWVLGVARDEKDVEYVRMYELNNG